MKKLLGFLNRNPEVVFFIGVFILWTAIMCNENRKEGGDFNWHDVKVEANGMILDLFVFGILVTVYNALRARKEKIERLKEELEDYQDWHEKEARFRIVGIVKRLVKEGIKKINLRKCYLVEASFGKIDLSESHFDMAILTDANFYNSVLVSSTFRAATLNGCIFHGTDLTDADFSNADLIGTKFSKGTNLTKAKFKDSLVLKTISYLLVEYEEYPLKSDVWFRQLEMAEVIGWEEIENKYYVDKNGTLQLK
jgi:hypothetical protein